MVVINPALCKPASALAVPHFGSAGVEPPVTEPVADVPGAPIGTVSPEVDTQPVDHATEDRTQILSAHYFESEPDVTQGPPGDEAAQPGRWFRAWAAMRDDRGREAGPLVEQVEIGTGG